MPTKTFFDTINTSYDLIKKEAWLQWNPNINQSDVRRYQKRAFAEIMTVVSWIYAISSLTDERLEWSLAIDTLQDLEVLLWSGYLLNKNYWQNQLSNTIFDEAADKIMEWKGILKEMSKGVVKLFDKDNIEFNRTSGEQSGWPVVSKTRGCPTFSPNQKF